MKKTFLYTLLIFFISSLCNTISAEEKIVLVDGTLLSGTLKITKPGKNIEFEVFEVLEKGITNNNDYSGLVEIPMSSIKTIVRSTINDTTGVKVFDRIKLKNRVPICGVLLSQDLGGVIRFLKTNNEIITFDSSEMEYIQKYTEDIPMIENAPYREKVKFSNGEAYFGLIKKQDYISGKITILVAKTKQDYIGNMSDIESIERFPPSEDLPQKEVVPISERKKQEEITNDLMEKKTDKFDAGEVKDDTWEDSKDSEDDNKSIW